MSRKVFKYSAVIASLLLTAVFAGCGTSNKEGSDPSAVADVPKVSESACAQCHGASVDHITGDNIYKDYIASAHFTNNKHVVGCQDCHGGGSQHNGVGPLPYPDPSAAGKCFECHKPAFLGNYEATKVPTAVEKAHFYNITGAGVHPGMYVTRNYEKSCTSCHDPHKADKGVGQAHTDWAESGHGDVNGLAWANRDFKKSTDCIRCHTSTGFIDYVQSNFTLPTATWASADDKGREVLTCKACHTDYNFKNRVRNVGAFTAPYNAGKSPKTFPSVGASNLCIPCHAGRESGDTVKAVTDFTNASFKNPHYLAAAGIFYAKAGFHFYTSTAKYGNPNWSHGKLGNNNYLAGGVDTGTSGPCVACHLAGGTNNRSHTLSAVEVAHATSTAGAARGCYGCHTGVTEPTIEGLIEEEKELFDRGMAFFLNNLNANGMFYDGANHPYWVKTQGASAKTASNQIKNWTYAALVGPSNGSGVNNMGVAFNYKVLNAEKGAHVHNRRYSRQLIYDSVEYLQFGTVTNAPISFTAYSTALTATPDANPVSISQLKSWLTSSGKRK